jgi:hypothetical protein
MQLEKQVCNLELAEKLNTLGVRQESLYHWQPWIYDHEEHPQQSKMVVVAEGAEDWSDDGESYSAFTVTELGEMLPKTVVSTKTLDFDKGEQWHCYSKDYDTFFYGTEADARAKMLIYLLENGLITPPSPQ